MKNITKDEGYKGNQEYRKIKNIGKSRIQENQEYKEDEEYKAN